MTGQDLVTKKARLLLKMTRFKSHWQFLKNKTTLRKRTNGELTSRPKQLRKTKPKSLLKQKLKQSRRTISEISATLIRQKLMPTMTSKVTGQVLGMNLKRTKSQLRPKTKKRKKTILVTLTLSKLLQRFRNRF